MKMTMHIDEALLERVRIAYGCSSKTEAVDFVLREADRRVRLKSFLKKGLGLSTAELKEAVDPAYTLDLPVVAEGKARYGRSRTRR